MTSCWTVPVRFGRLEQRLGDGQSGAVHHEIDATEGEKGRVDRRLDGARIGDVDGARQRPRRLHRARWRRDSAFVTIEVGDHHAGSLRSQPGGDRLSDTARRAGDEGYTAGMAPGLGEALQFRLLEGPILDPELLCSRRSANRSRLLRPRA